MRAGKRWISAWMLSLGLALPATAQEAPAYVVVDSLTRVRVVRPQMVPRVIRGRLLSADTASLVVGTGRGQMSIPMEGVQRVDVSAGRRVGVRRGAAAGFLGSVGMVGTLFLMGSVSSPDNEGLGVDLNDLAVSLAPRLVIGMTAVGAIAGALIPGRERWLRNALPVRIAPSTPPPIVEQRQP